MWLCTLVMCLHTPHKRMFRQNVYSSDSQSGAGTHCIEGTRLRSTGSAMKLWTWGMPLSALSS